MQSIHRSGLGQGIVAEECWDRLIHKRERLPALHPRLGLNHISPMAHLTRRTACEHLIFHSPLAILAGHAAKALSGGRPRIKREQKLALRRDGSNQSRTRRSGSTILSHRFAPELAIFIA